MARGGQIVASLKHTIFVTLPAKCMHDFVTLPTKEPAAAASSVLRVTLTSEYSLS